LGHAYSALINWDLALKSGGKFLLRMEDIDGGRSRPEFEDGIFEDLKWLGIDWEEPVRRQSEHLDDYQRALDRLNELGVLYPCFCTRKDILAEIGQSKSAPHGPFGAIYPGLCRNLTDAERHQRLAGGDNHAIRLDVEKALSIVAAKSPSPITWQENHNEAQVTLFCDLSLLGDVVLARKDIPTSYHLAVTIDDHLQGISLVVRGQDLFVATNIHRLLQALLDLDTPHYWHHKLIEGPTGEKLSKRKHAPTLQSLRADGVTPEDVRQMLGLDSLYATTY
jgi:glutamyl-Q tRNA(Asp) synthetase